MAPATVSIKALLRKSSDFMWSPECQAEFVQIKSILSDDRYNSPFDPTLNTKLLVDTLPEYVEAETEEAAVEETAHDEEASQEAAAEAAEEASVLGSAVLPPRPITASPPLSQLPAPGGRGLCQRHRPGDNLGNSKTTAERSACGRPEGSRDTHCTLSNAAALTNDRAASGRSKVTVEFASSVASAVVAAVEEIAQDEALREHFPPVNSLA